MTNVQHQALTLLVSKLNKLTLNTEHNYLKRIKLFKRIREY